MNIGDKLIDKRPVRRQGSPVLRVRVVEAISSNKEYVRLRTIKEYLPEGYVTGWYSPNVGRTTVSKVSTINRQMKPYIEPVL